MLLNTEYLPWKIVSKAELKALEKPQQTPDYDQEIERLVETQEQLRAENDDLQATTKKLKIQLESIQKAQSESLRNQTRKPFFDDPKYKSSLDRKN